MDGASGGEAKLANVLKNALEIGFWREAHGSISVQKPQPNLLASYINNLQKRLRLNP
jgi:hypothetical protein